MRRGLRGAPGHGLGGADGPPPGGADVPRPGAPSSLTLPYGAGAGSGDGDRGVTAEKTTAPARRAVSPNTVPVRARSRRSLPVRTERASGSVAVDTAPARALSRSRASSGPTGSGSRSRRAARACSRRLVVAGTVAAASAAASSTVRPTPSQSSTVRRYSGGSSSRARCTGSAGGPPGRRGRRNHRQGASACSKARDRTQPTGSGSWKTSGQCSHARWKACSTESKASPRRPVSRYTWWIRAGAARS
uniref:Regulator protein n=1 Tax=Streptomyces fradiae TaxID=1906 RepID=Q9Z9I3_STRFR|nr:regulator protein [Streptomyces fradiae]